jgi:hypothetical protein
MHFLSLINAKGQSFLLLRQLPLIAIVGLPQLPSFVASGIESMTVRHVDVNPSKS